MLTTKNLPGTPVWLDLGSPDLPATVAFYTALFGWSHHTMPGGGDYGSFQQDGKTVAAVGRLTEEGADPAWILYFRSTDAEATAKAVEQAGGTVRMAPSEVGPEGRIAQFSDPAGAQFAIWEPGRLKGLELVTVPGSLCWAELYTPDAGGGHGFYRSVFDWSFEDMPMGEMTYTVVTPPGGDADDSMAGLVPMPGVAPHWLPYIEVGDCDAVVAKARELGGAVAVAAESVEGVGRFATLTDPHGVRFAVMTSSG
ncbi:VOC family protein [Nonomuraea sp. NPDC050547]|uniref:VOC family protein n=1 Tax=Nonomuraea sp. NPDC050547 TaxID=3364368 RepID=UPI0037A41C62